MKSIVPHVLEMGRNRHGLIATDSSYGFTGMFHVMGPQNETLRIVASSSEIPECEGWEHVSVSTRRRCPTWEEMCFVKDLFWKDDELAFQLHPAKSEHINNHPYCLHLWRNARQDPPLPPAIFVGDKSKGLLSKGEAYAMKLKQIAEDER